MQTAICLLSVVPMRKEPSHRSEMVSQLLFGEYVETGEEKEDFVFVKCLYDGYEGWVQASQLTPVAEVIETKNFMACAQGEVIINGHYKTISIGSPILGLSAELCFGDTAVQYSISQDCFWNSDERKNEMHLHLEKVCLRYLYTPYLWGGKSIYGIDCSGFVQQVFKLFGVKLLRDAYLQAEQGAAVASLEESRLSDLAFFQNEKGKIVHVGILLEGSQIVHASGKVRIDVMDEEGILNKENRRRTHRLHSIKRFF